MHYINENDMMDYYISLVQNNQIEFLKEKPKEKESVIELVNQLKACQNLHERIDVAKILWKRLFEYALSYIHPDKGGYDELFSYFDAYVDFEELIFASDSFYRDHTLHCLWVYFLGEYIHFDAQFNSIVKPFYVRTMKALGELLETMEKYEVDSRHTIELKKQLNNIPCNDSIRCITSLTHDLGYPLKKIKKINSGIKKVLPYFGLDDFNEFQFKYQPAHMAFIQQFLKLMSLELSFTNDSTLTNKLPSDWRDRIFELEGVNLVGIKKGLDQYPAEETKLLLSNLGFHYDYAENTAKQLQYSLDFEKMQHGIMSAYILSRNLNVFKNIQMISTSLSDVKISIEDNKLLYAMSEIFSAIADHTNESYKIKSITDAPSFLAFIDEIEEFSRISRANQNRQFITEFCKTTISMNEDVFVLNFVFDNMEIDNLDPERAFKGRCKKLLTLFDIANLDSDLKIELNCIGELDYNRNTYTLLIRQKFVDVMINGVSQDIPSYLSSRQFYTKEVYQTL